MKPAPVNAGVEFDDFKITHTKSNLIQANEYYPFGLQTANSWTRENTTGNNFLGNGGTELNTTSNLYDLAYRNYDPALGRMHQVDPMTDKYSSLTPYNFSFNDPVAFNDPSGADPDYVTRRGVSNPGGVFISNPDYARSVMSRSNDFFAPGQWGPNTNSLSYGNVGGMNMSNIAQMQKDAKEMDPQEYAAKYGTAATNREIGQTFKAMGFNADVSISSGQAYITFVNPAVYSSTRGLLEMQSNNLAVIDAVGNAVGTHVTAIVFKNEGEAYKYMWNNSFDAQGRVSKEMAAFNTAAGTIVQPTSGIRRTKDKYYSNDERHSYNDYLPLGRNSQGELVLPFMYGYTKINNQVHTHPNDQIFGSYEVLDDKRFQSTMNIPVFLIRNDGVYNLGGRIGPSEGYFNGSKTLRN